MRLDQIKIVEQVDLRNKKSYRLIIPLNASNPNEKKWATFIPFLSRGVASLLLKVFYKGAKVLLLTTAYSSPRDAIDSFVNNLVVKASELGEIKSVEFDWVIANGDMGVLDSSSRSLLSIEKDLINSINSNTVISKQKNVEFVKTLIKRNLYEKFEIKP